MMRRLVILFALVGMLTAAVLSRNPAPKPVSFPDGKRFAFSIIDDTDLATLERLRPIYDVLIRNGLRTTKTVWVLPTNHEALDANRGDTLSDEAYRDFVLDLQRRGFEIALHGVRGGSSDRADILRGLEAFKAYVGRYPTMHMNHAQNRDNLYWGGFRYSFTPLRWLGNVAMSAKSFGHVPESEHFWGDFAREHVKYVRQFTFNEVNLLKVNPSMPFRREDTPYVNFWFQTSNGANLDAFSALLGPSQLDQLEHEGGVCLVYAHLGAGSFNREEGLDPRFESRIKDLASRNGWFAPASEILDYLSRQPGWTGTLGLTERLRIESQFTVFRIRNGGA